MSEEEKKAIEFLKVAKELKIVLSCSFGNNGEFEFNNLQKQQFDIILNLIEKQQKTIEELKGKLEDNIFRGVEEEVLEEFRQKIKQQQKEIEELKEYKHMHEDLCD